MKDIVREYIENGKEIEKIREETKTKKGEVLEERNKELENISDKKHALEVEERNIRQTAEQKESGLDAEENLKLKSYQDQREAVKRIVEFLEVQERNKQASLVGDFEVILHDDEYFKLGVQIIRNQKPVNCFDVVVLGDCVFYEPLIKQPYHGHYGVTLNSVKTEDDARKLIEKKKATIGQDVIKQVEALKKEYMEVIKTWKLSDFDELFEYNCCDCRERFDTKVSEHTRQVWNDKTGLREPCTGTLHRVIKRTI